MNENVEITRVSSNRYRRSIRPSLLPRFRKVIVAALSAMSLGACTEDFRPSGRHLEVPQNGGAHGPDAGRDRDASVPDAGKPDGAPPDAGGLDAGGLDAGVPPDAGTEDAGDQRAPCEKGVVTCDDGNACIIGERCAPFLEGHDENGCVPGIVRETSDGVDCTEDRCNPLTGEISHTPINAACPQEPCKTVLCEPERGCAQSNVVDGTLCDIFEGIDEACFNGSCAPACDVDEDCRDETTCTMNTCNIAAGRCEFTPDDALCDDSRFCTGEERCNPFHADAEPETGCAPAERVPVCEDDGKICTQEICHLEEDRCLSMPRNKFCNDGNPCNGEEICDPALGAADTGCTDPVDTDCSHLSTQCRVGICNVASGLCEERARPNGTECDDEEFCNVGETCQDGDCRDGEERNCSDDNICTTDSCNEGDAVCENIALDCSGLDGQCVTGVCNLETGRFETQDRPNNPGCDDSNFCTDGDTCQEGLCASGPDRDCSDVIDCTIDTCSREFARCIHTPENALCADVDLCTVDSCDIDLGECTHAPRECITDTACKVGVCLPDTGECGEINAPDGIACNDGIACTLNDQCQTGVCGGTAPVEVRWNGIDDDCDGWADESAGFDVQCDGGMRITPPGAPTYNCVGAELIEIPSMPRGTQSTQVSLPPDGTGRGRLVSLMPLGSNYTEIRAAVNGGFANFAPFACPRPSPPDKSIVCIEAPSPGFAGFSDTITFGLTP